MTHAIKHKDISQDLVLAHKVGAAVVRSIRSLGFNWNFAPVLDIDAPAFITYGFAASAVQADGQGKS